MTTDDILSCDFHLEGPSSAASFKLYFQQTVDQLTGSAPFRLADAAVDKMNVPLRDILSDEWFFSGVTVRKHAVGVEPAFSGTASIVNNDTQGQLVGTALPANNAIVIAISQGAHSAKHDGRIFVPGIPEVVTSGGTLDPAFSSGVLQTFVDAIGSSWISSPDGATFEVGVINRSILDAAPPAKDWEGAFSFATFITARQIVGIQRRRTTKVRGAINKS
jgi:hypothetical protein